MCMNGDGGERGVRGRWQGGGEVVLLRTSCHLPADTATYTLCPGLPRCLAFLKRVQISSGPFPELLPSSRIPLGHSSLCSWKQCPPPPVWGEVSTFQDLLQPCLLRAILVPPCDVFSLTLHPPGFLQDQEWVERGSAQTDTPLSALVLGFACPRPPHTKGAGHMAPEAPDSPVFFYLSPPPAIRGTTAAASCDPHSGQTCLPEQPRLCQA